VAFRAEALRLRAALKAGAHDLAAGDLQGRLRALIDRSQRAGQPATAPPILLAAAEWLDAAGDPLGARALTDTVLAWPDADTLDQRGHRALRERLDAAGLAASGSAPLAAPAPGEALAWAAQRIAACGTMASLGERCAPR
jgi:hypothetical protein